MADFREIPVIEVDKDNFCELWPSIVLSIQSATFVAIDAELSGIGAKKLLFAKAVDDRYKEMCDASKTRSVISLGLSCFKVLPNEGIGNESGDSKSDDKALSFQVQTFNIMILCNENYIVEPTSLRFLIEHGFDFNKQYSQGIPYYRGNDKERDDDKQSMRRLFTELVLSKVPIILHNAMVDLVFMYQSFYANVPASLQTFLADLTEIFSGGVYDTKYIAEFKARMPASYLEYVFRKCQRDNCKSMDDDRQHTCMRFPTYPASMGDTVVMLPCALDDQPEVSQDGKSDMCISYAAHGWCKLGNSCPGSHDIDFILDNEDKIIAKKQRKRQKKKQKFEHNGSTNNVEDENDAKDKENSMDVEEDDESDHLECNETSASKQNHNDELSTASKDELSNVSKELSTGSKEINLSHEKCVSVVRKTGGHRAGFDSFMTGFAFAVFISKYGKSTLCSATSALSDMGVDDFTNKLPLSGKDIPLIIQKSNFSKNSKDHLQKYKSIHCVV